MKQDHNKPYIVPEMEIAHCETVAGLLANSLAVYDKPSDPNQDALCPEKSVSDSPWGEKTFSSSIWNEE